jgi:hypothetical protein
VPFLKLASRFNWSSIRSNLSSFAQKQKERRTTAVVCVVVVVVVVAAAVVVVCVAGIRRSLPPHRECRHRCAGIAKPSMN